MVETTIKPQRNLTVVLNWLDEVELKVPTE